jgi:hypothetical protein
MHSVCKKCRNHPDTANSATAPTAVTLSCTEHWSTTAAAAAATTDNSSTSRKWAISMLAVLGAEHAPTLSHRYAIEYTQCVAFLQLAQLHLVQAIAVLNQMVTPPLGEKTLDSDQRHTW